MPLARRRFSSWPANSAKQWTWTTWRPSAWRTGRARSARGTTTCGVSPAMGRCSGSSSRWTSIFATPTIRARANGFRPININHPTWGKRCRDSSTTRYPPRFATGAVRWRCAAAQTLETLVALVSQRPPDAKRWVAEQADVNDDQGDEAELQRKVQESLDDQLARAAELVRAGDGPPASRLPVVQSIDGGAASGARFAAAQRTSGDRPTRLCGGRAHGPSLRRGRYPGHGVCLDSR